MDKLETRLLQGAEVKPHTWWRFIDDIVIIRTEWEEKLTEFLNRLNNDTIKFTSKWSTEEIGFLDVRVVKGFGRLETDLFVKATESHQYLVVIRGRVKQGIPFSQAMRLRRICSRQRDFEKRAADLTAFLVNREYKKGFAMGSGG